MASTRYLLSNLEKRATYLKLASSNYVPNIIKKEAFSILLNQGLKQVLVKRSPFNILDQKGQRQVLVVKISKNVFTLKSASSNQPMCQMSIKRSTINYCQTYCQKCFKQISYQNSASSKLVYMSNVNCKVSFRFIGNLHI